MIPEKHKVAIVEMVCEYVVLNRFIPHGMLLNINLSLKPVLPVTISDTTNQYNPQVLDLNPVDAFHEFCEKQGYINDRVYTTARKTLENNRNNRSEPFTIRSVVTRFSDVMPLYGAKEVDRLWLRYYPNFGRKSLRCIDEWLASLNLHRGMRL